MHRLVQYEKDQSLLTTRHKVGSISTVVSRGSWASETAARRFI